MARLWDSFRWRLVAAWSIARWIATGAKVEDHGFPLSRWTVARIAWSGWRIHFMYKHEKHTYISAEDFLDSLEDRK